MYVELADKLVVSSAADQFSPAVSMTGADALMLSMVVIVIPGLTTLTYDLHGSNDLQNWVSFGTLTATAVGFFSVKTLAVFGWRYARARMNSNNAGIAIVEIGLNTAQLG